MLKSNSHCAVDFSPLTQEKSLEVVALQRRYLKANLADLSNGFLEWETPLVDLIKYSDFDSTFTASIAGQLVAYVLAFDLEVAHQMTNPKQYLPVLDQLLFDGQPITDYRVCIGQILVDKPFRKRRIARQLFAAFIDSAREKYDLRLVGINEQNRGSYHLHHNILGMKPIGTFGERRDHLLLVLDMREPSKVSTCRT
jgi:GNAT superfamily N-acetyltransferase